MKKYFHRHQNPSPTTTVLLAGLGTALTIAALGYLGQVSSYAFLMAPFGASCALKFAAPASPFSQPINVVGGHLLSAAIGILFAQVLPGHMAMVGLAAGAAVMAMVALRVLHPPAGATAIVTYLTAPSWAFLVFPVLTGSILMVVIAVIYHRLAGTVYPSNIPKT